MQVAVTEMRLIQMNLNLDFIKITERTGGTALRPLLRQCLSCSSSKTKEKSTNSLN